eukprot:4113509-Alexandrium_andersonii.AAC.1
MAFKQAAKKAKRARMQATRKLNGTWARLIKCRNEERKRRWIASGAADQLRFVISSSQSAGRFFQATGRYQRRYREWQEAKKAFQQIQARWEKGRSKWYGVFERSRGREAIAGAVLNDWLAAKASDSPGEFAAERRAWRIAMRE